MMWKSRTLRISDFSVYTYDEKISGVAEKGDISKHLEWIRLETNNEHKCEIYVHDAYQATVAHLAAKHAFFK